MNEHIRKYLEYYILSDDSYQHAVVIDGEWGAGKSYFLQSELIDIKYSDVKIINISLYGLENTEQIDTEIYSNLHPLLSSKPVALLNTVIKGALKGILKIDIGEDINAKLDLSLPSINLQDFSNPIKKVLMVFDDFERCNIPPQILLGYINQFIEKDECKVIIITNELEVVADNSSYRKKYLETKEKVVGKTFNITPDIEISLNSFISMMSDKGFKKFLGKVKNDFIEICKVSGCKNLRLLKQFLFDFERLYLSLEKQVKKREDLCLNLMTLYFILFYEHKKRSWERDALDEHNWNYGSKDEESTANQLSEKYNYQIFYDTLIPLNLWIDIIFDSRINKNEINQHLISNDIFDTLDKKWYDLWHYTRLSDGEFDELYLEVYNQLRKNEISGIEVALHSSGVLLNLANLNVINLDKEDIVTACKSCVSNIISQRDLPTEYNHFKINISEGSWGGLGYQGRDTIEFKTIIDYINEKLQLSFEKKIPALVKDLVAMIPSNPSNFYRRMNGSESEYSWVRKNPILSYCDIGFFLENYLSCREKNKINTLLEERYTTNPYKEKLTDELNWLIELRKEACLLRERNKTLLSGYFLKTLDERYLTPLISSMSKTTTTEH